MSGGVQARSDAGPVVAGAEGPCTPVVFEDGHAWYKMTVLGFKGQRTPVLWRPYSLSEINEHCAAMARIMDMWDALTFDVLTPDPKAAAPASGLASASGASSA